MCCCGEHNRQRDKSLDEKLREELVTADPDEAYEALLRDRADRSDVKLAAMDLGHVRHRKGISAGGKRPFADAVVRLVMDAEEYWPLSDRRVHYLLLNDPPMRHASKPGSRYRNDRASYGDLTDLLTRLRLAGEIPMHAIGDETRPVTQWDVHPDPRGFVRREVGRFLKGYRRDLQRSQPCHIEVICEKNTARPIIEPAAGRYGIPVTTGRGYCSLPPRAEMAGRFFRSGKTRLVLLGDERLRPGGLRHRRELRPQHARRPRRRNRPRDQGGVDPGAGPRHGTAGRHVGQAHVESCGPLRPASRGPHVWELEALPP